MTTPTIKSALTVDEAAVIDVVTLAFSTDPVARWIYPNPYQYLTHMPPFIKAFAGKAFTHESAYYVEGYAGYRRRAGFTDGTSLLCQLSPVDHTLCVRRTIPHR